MVHTPGRNYEFSSPTFSSPQQYSAKKNVAADLERLRESRRVSRNVFEPGKDEEIWTRGEQEKRPRKEQQSFLKKRKEAGVDNRLQSRDQRGRSEQRENLQNRIQKLLEKRSRSRSAKKRMNDNEISEKAIESEEIYQTSQREKNAYMQPQKEGNKFISKGDRGSTMVNKQSENKSERGGLYQMSQRRRKEYLEKSETVVKLETPERDKNDYIKFRREENNSLSEVENESIGINKVSENTPEREDLYQMSQVNKKEFFEQRKKSWLKSSSPKSERRLLNGSNHRYEVGESKTLYQTPSRSKKRTGKKYESPGAAIELRRSYITPKKDKKEDEQQNIEENNNFEQKIQEIKKEDSSESPRKTRLKKLQHSKYSSPIMARIIDKKEKKRNSLNLSSQKALDSSPQISQAYYSSSKNQNTEFKERRIDSSVSAESTLKERCRSPAGRAFAAYRQSLYSDDRKDENSDHISKSISVSSLSGMEGRDDTNAIREIQKSRLDDNHFNFSDDNQSQTWNNAQIDDEKLQYGIFGKKVLTPQEQMLKKRALGRSRAHQKNNISSSGNYKNSDIKDDEELQSSNSRERSQQTHVEEVGSYSRKFGSSYIDSANKCRDTESHAQEESRQPIDEARESNDEQKIDSPNDVFAHSTRLIALAKARRLLGLESIRNPEGFDNKEEKGHQMRKDVKRGEEAQKNDEEAKFSRSLPASKSFENKNIDKNDEIIERRKKKEEVTADPKREDGSKEQVKIRKSDISTSIDISETFAKSEVTVESRKEESENIPYFKEYALSVRKPSAPQKIYGMMKGYSVWCSHGFQKPIRRFSWTPPTKMFDATFLSVEEANERAEYLFYSKNPFKANLETMKESYDNGESIKKKCRSFHCTPIDGGPTWKVAVVPSEVFEWLDYSDINCHPFDESNSSIDEMHDS